jgi:hypothetical protein
MKVEETGNEKIKVDIKTHAWTIELDGVVCPRCLYEHGFILNVDQQDDFVDRWYGVCDQEGDWIEFDFILTANVDTEGRIL